MWRYLDGYLVGRSGVAKITHTPPARLAVGTRLPVRPASGRAPVR
ncbi:hypothetical protein AB0B79_37125 [Streptomyces sp. NPDC039022]